MNRLPYVYQLTDNVNGKKYIGAQWGVEAHPNNLGKRYFTSSELVSSLFKSTPERFSIEVLFTGEAEIVREKEIQLLEHFDCANSPDFYNLRNSTMTVESSKKGGRIIGAIHKQSGHAERLGKEYGPQNAHHGGRANSESGHISRLGKSQGAINAINGHLSFLRTRDHQIRAGSLGGKISGPIVIALRYICEECGKSYSPPSLGNHQKYSGHRGIIK